MYRKAFARELASKPDAVIAFEPEAAALLLSGRGSRSQSIFRVVHLHEHPTRDAYAASVLGRWSLGRTLSWLHLAGAVVVANEHRGKELERIARLQSPPIAVMNCPLLLSKLPKSRLQPLARERGASGPIIH